jgi:geranylgeranyl diphosphate synthase type I
MIMQLESLTQAMLPAIEREMKRVVAEVNDPATTALHGMLAFHMGWEGEGAGPKAQGKRVRPLLVLLSAGAAGGDWRQAVPAAASVELLHNFSLIHDDIEDDSPLRRGRRTLWKKWGLAQGINAGDTLYTLAYTAMLGMHATCGAEAAVAALDVLQRTCLALTQGQYLDLSFERRDNVSVDEYWQMIGGKTASLLAACTELGALSAGAVEEIRYAYRNFGRYLGLAFQVQDDLLGIWGDPAVTGKSAASDLAAGKKSLPVLYGLEQNGAFAARWLQGPVSEDQAGELADLLAACGARKYTQTQANELTTHALESLAHAGPQGAPGEALNELAGMLLKRNL